MRPILMFLLLLLAALNGAAQTPVIQWQKSFGSAGIDQCYAIQHTNDGGYIMAGSSNANGGDVSGNHGLGDYWIVKINDTGMLQWQRSFGGTLGDGANAIQQTTDGGYVIAGTSNSNDGDVSGNNGESDYWVVKINDTGGLQWQKSLGGPDGDIATCISQTRDGGYIVAGRAGTDGGDISGSHGQYDYWVVKLNDTGAIQWQRSLGGSRTDDASSIVQTTDGGYIVAGYTISTDGDVIGNHGNYDYWIVKLSDTGAIQWQKSLGGSGTDLAYSIQQTTDGGYIVAGQSNSTDGDVTGNHGNSDYWIVKLNDTGAIQWQKSLGGDTTELATSIEQTADGGYIVSGSSNSNDGDVSGNHGYYDYWVIKLNDTGAIQWQKSLGGDTIDFAWVGIQQTGDGGYAVAGYSLSNDGDVSGNHGNYDYWIVKLTCGLSAGTISGLANICLDSSATLADTAGGGVWSISNSHATITGGTVTAATTGIDTVIYTVTNACGSSSTAYPIHIIHCPEDVNQQSAVRAISILPNPTTGELFITGAEHVHIVVYNLLGQAVKAAVNANTLSITELAPAMYFVKVFNEQGLLLQQDKIVKR